jgi:hypothetical protein
LLLLLGGTKQTSSVSARQHGGEKEVFDWKSTERWAQLLFNCDRERFRSEAIFWGLISERNNEKKYSSNGSEGVRAIAKQAFCDI